jgi:hypothetical protein
MRNSSNLYSKYISDQRIAVKMVKFCRSSFGDRGDRWDYSGSRNIQFQFREEKDRTWFYFIFAHDLKDPNEG